MSTPSRVTRFAFLAATLLGIPAALEAQSPIDLTLPDGVTPAMVTEGAKIFKGPGLCVACHGSDGKGGVGANLTDGAWLHSSGSYDDIVHQINTGVSQKESVKGVPMPPKGGSTLSESQVKAVAAYVWTLSHPAPK